MSISSQERVPGVYQLHRHVRGQGRTLASRLVLVGARSSTVSAKLDGELVRVRNRAESQTLFHAGSMLDLMMRMALAAGQMARNDRPPGGTPQLFCVPLAPVSSNGAEKATFTLVITGVATNSASVALHIQDMVIRVPVAKGDTAEVVAERLLTYAKRAESDCGYLASVADATLTLTARESGVWGNQLYLALDADEVNGIEAAVTRTNDGAGELDITAARAPLLSVDWSGVCFPGSVGAMPATIKGYADDAWQYASGHAPLVVTGCTGDINTALATARAYNHRHIAMTWAEHVPGAGNTSWSAGKSARSHDFEVAAAVAARLFSQEKENANYNLASLPCYGRSASIERQTLNEAIAAGITVVLRPALGDAQAHIVDPVVTMSRDEHGALDTEWQPVECVRVKAAITRLLATELRGFPRMDGDDDTRASAISAALAVLRDAARRKLVRAPVDDDVAAEYKNVNGSRRLVIELAYGVIVGLDIVEVTHNISRAR